MFRLRRYRADCVEVDLDRQMEELRSVCLPYRGEYAGNANYKRAVAEQF